jgi:hypothetical protein
MTVLLPNGVGEVEVASPSYIGAAQIAARAHLDYQARRGDTLALMVRPTKGGELCRVVLNGLGGTLLAAWR